MEVPGNLESAEGLGTLGSRRVLPAKQGAGRSEAISCCGAVGLIVLPGDILLLGELLHGIVLLPWTERGQGLEPWSSHDLGVVLIGDGGVVVEIVPLEEGCEVRRGLGGSARLLRDHGDVLHLHTGDGVLVIVPDRLTEPNGTVVGQVLVALNRWRLGSVGRLLPEKGGIGLSSLVVRADGGNQRAPLANIVNPPNNGSAPLALRVPLRDVALVDDLGDAFAGNRLFARHCKFKL